MRSKPTIFISYSQEDSAVAEKLATELSNQQFGIFVDRWRIKPGESIVERISTGIEESDYLILLISENSLASEWVRLEWTAALAKQLSDKSIMVIPLLIENCQLPAILRSTLYIDFTHDFKTGIKQLIDLLNQELSPAIKTASVRSRRIEDNSDAALIQRLKNLKRRELRLIANQCLSLEDLITACFDLEVDYDNIRGSTKNEKIIFLILELATDDLLADFVFWLIEERRACVKNILDDFQDKP